MRAGSCWLTLLSGCMLAELFRGTGRIHYFVGLVADYVRLLLLLVLVLHLTLPLRYDHERNENGTDSAHATQLIPSQSEPLLLLCGRHGVS